jgi:hypothetical protein
MAPVIIAFAAINVLKLSVLLTFSPASQPDTFSYVTYADVILSDDFRHVDLLNNPLPITLTRAIRVPAVIAGAKIAFGQYWAWAVVLLQYAVSLIADGLPAGPRLSAWRLVEPRCRRRAGDRHAVRG